MANDKTKIQPIYLVALAPSDKSKAQIVTVDTAKNYIELIKLANIQF